MLVDRTTQRVRELRALARLLWRTSRPLLLAFGALTLVRGLLPPLIIVLTGRLVDTIPDAVAHGLGSPEGSGALGVLAVIGLAFLANGVFGAVSGYVTQALSSLFTLTVHEAVTAAAAVPAGIAELEDPAAAGELAAVEEYDREGIFGRVAPSLQSLLHARVQGVAAFVILLGFRWWVPVILFAVWRLSDRVVSQPMDEAAMAVHHERGTGLSRARYVRGLVVDAPAAKEVRVFGLGDWIVGQYSRAWFTAMPEVWRRRRSGRRAMLVVAVCLVAVHGLVFAALARSAWAGALSVAALAVFAQAVLATDALGPLLEGQWELRQALHGSGKVRDLERRLARAVPEVPTGTAVPSPPRSPAADHRGARPVGVRLHAVRFGYPGQRGAVLDGLSLDVPAGQCLAVVGANGAGKTTLIKLLCGMYEPDAGTVTLDDAPPRVARSRIAAIFQDFVRYELPLRANVGFGSLPLSCDPRTLEGALTDAGAAELPGRLAAGWDTVLARDYDEGADLSGGQWQKVALARAFMAVRGGAGLLVLDEPTAHLDVRAEIELFDQVLRRTREAGNVTTILVSHRLSSVRRADRIVVVAGGRVTEDGSHEDCWPRAVRTPRCMPCRPNGSP